MDTIERFVEGIIADIKFQRLPRNDGEKDVPVAGRIDLIGGKYIESVVQNIKIKKVELGISSIEDLSNLYCITFPDGTRTYTINLDKIAI